MGSMFTVGQVLNLERNPIYATSVTQAKMQESSRTISVVKHFENGRIGIKFKGSNIWYSVREDSEWITSIGRRYRNLDWEAK